MSPPRLLTVAISIGLLGLTVGLAVGTAHADSAEEVACKGFDARQLQGAADFLKDQITAGRDAVEVVPIGDFTLVCAH